MFVEFDSLPAHARIWVYQSEKRFTESEKKSILNKVRPFIDSWDAHGAPLLGSAKIFYDHFLVISVDEGYNAASGCSIDKSVRTIMEIERDLNLVLLDRSKQSYLQQEAVMFGAIPEMKKKIKEGEVKKDTFTFNNQVANKSEFESKWLIPAKDSWLFKYFDN